MAVEIFPTNGRDRKNVFSGETVELTPNSLTEYLRDKLKN